MVSLMSLCHQARLTAVCWGFLQCLESLKDESADFDKKYQRASDLYGLPLVHYLLHQQSQTLPSSATLLNISNPVS